MKVAARFLRRAAASVATAAVAAGALAGASAAERPPPRVIVTTDINNGSGDPDDRQSLCHLLWYADELDLRAVVPDRFSETAAQACHQVIDNYQRDYDAPGTRFRERGFPAPDQLRHDVLVTDREQAVARLIEEAKAPESGPLWVLVWGNMNFVSQVLDRAPEIAPQLRIVTIGTFRRARENGGDGSLRNWNGAGRQEVYDRFPDLWWLEIEWAYNGMFVGHDAVAFKDELARTAGALGRHVRAVIATVNWADNFRAGDTPSVLFLLDPNGDRDNPSHPSWAGRFTRPFPLERPHYWTGVAGETDWDFAEPTNSWLHASTVYRARVDGLLEQRPAMYRATLEKIAGLYGTEPDVTAVLEAQARSPETPEFDGTSTFNLTPHVSTSGASEWHFDLTGEPGPYHAEIQYRAPAGAAQRVLFVNASHLGETRFPTSEPPQPLAHQFTAHLERGPNSVIVQPGNGQLELRTLTLSPHN